MSKTLPGSSPLDPAPAKLALLAAELRSAFGVANAIPIDATMFALTATLDDAASIVIACEPVIGDSGSC